MDSAIFDEESIWENEEDDPFEDRIVRALKVEDRDEFIELIESETVQEMAQVTKSRFASKVLYWTLKYNASLSCGYFLARAPRIGLPVNLNVPLHEYGLLPIHVAATTPPFCFLRSFLVEGARSDIACDNRRSSYYLMLPIEAALSRVPEKISWDPSQSVYRLIFSLAQWEYGGGGLFGAIHMLLEDLDDELKLEVIYRLVQEEKFVELAALLFADASYKPGHCIGLSNEVFMRLRTSFTAEIISLMEEEYKFPSGNGNGNGNGNVEEEYKFPSGNGNGNGDGELAATIRRKKALMIVMLLLEVFYRADMDVIPGTINNHEVLARNIVDAGFHLTDEDLTSLNDVLARQKRGKTATARLRAERLEAIPSYYLQPRALFHKMCCGQQRPIKMRNSHFTLSSVGKRAFSSAVQGFQAAHGVKFGFKTMLCTPMDSQSQLVKATHAKELQTLNSSLCKKLPLCAAAIRRLLRA